MLDCDGSALIYRYTTTVYYAAYSKRSDDRLLPPLNMDQFHAPNATEESDVKMLYKLHPRWALAAASRALNEKLPNNPECASTTPPDAIGNCRSVQLI